MNEIKNAKELIVNKTKAVAKPNKGYKQLLESYLPELQKVMRGQDPNKLMRTVLGVVSGSPDLQSAARDNPLSVVSAALELAAKQLDLSVHNEVFLVPYGGKNPGVVVQEGYKGLAKLAHRAARRMKTGLEYLSASEICENDRYERRKGARPDLLHEMPPFGTDRGAVMGYYAVARYADGSIYFQEMTVPEVKEHKKRFSKAKFGPFADPANFDAYGRKTVLRALIRRELPMDVELSVAVEKDIAIETGELETVEQPEITVTQVKEKEYTPDLEELLPDYDDPEFLAEVEKQEAELA